MNQRVTPRSVDSLTLVYLLLGVLEKTFTYVFPPARDQALRRIAQGEAEHRTGIDAGSGYETLAYAILERPTLSPAVI